MAARDLPDDELRRLTMNGIGLGLAAANVIMQLALLPIGHGVANSTVESGSLHAHPVKRVRTTLAFIVIALYGTDAERAVMRAEVNRQHRFVHSEPGAEVAYDAFDPALQLWVAACMYRGVLDAVGFLYGPSSPRVEELLYRSCTRFATTLQVSEALWPADRASFERYFEETSRAIAMDDLTRAFLYGLASLDFLPRPVAAPLAPLHRFLTAGFLPARFRDELGLKWSAGRERAFRVVLAGLAALNRSLPRVVREFPFNVVLADTKRRIRRSRPVV